MSPDPITDQPLLTETPLAGRSARRLTPGAGWLFVCLAWMLAVAGADLYLDRHGDSPVVLIGLLIGGPLLAMLRLDFRRTAFVNGTAVVIALLVAREHHLAWSPDLLTRFAVLASACAFSFWGTARRLQGAQLRENLLLAARRSEFLAEASTMLGSSLDYEETLRNVARAAVPQLADWCAVDLLDERRIDRVAVAHADPEMVRLTWELHERFRPSLGDPHGVGAVIRSGEGAFHPEITREMLAASARTPEHLRVAEEVGLSSAMLVPIAASGKVIGCVTFVNTRGSRAFTAEDFALATHLASGAARAIEHARVHRDRDHIARTLQRALLPPALPKLPGMDIAARYRPVGEGTDVGGDFYDCLKVGPGQWLTVLGDVQGKGVEAATLTSLVHHSLRTIALQETSPAEILRRLNEVVLANRHDNRFCTLALARLTLRECGGVDGVVALGGHLPPLLRRADGGVRPIGTPGTLIGAVPHPQVHDFEFSLSHGDALLLFSDGLSEARRGRHQLSERGVADVLADCHAAHPEAICDELEQAALDFQAGAVGDDVTMLCVRVPERAPRTSTRSFPVAPKSVPEIRHASVSVLEDLPDVDTDTVALLITELAANAVLHGSGGRRAGDAVELVVEVDDERVRCEVVNHGASFTATALPPEPSESHGRGLMLVDALAARWAAEQRSDGRQAVWFELDRSSAVPQLTHA